MTPIAAAREVLDAAIVARIFPAAAFEAGGRGGVLGGAALGTLSFDTDAPATVETVFDLASLTKVMATTTAIMDLVNRQVIGLDDPVSTFLAEWRGADRETVTIRDLLEHASGLSARLVDAPPAGRREFEHEICTMALEYEPRTRSIYSDLGFILLGFLAEDRGVRLDADTADDRAHAAPTLPMADDPRRGRLLVGEVHDNYAAALGGVAGHAGLFGTVSGVGRFARTVLSAHRGDGGMPPPFSPALVAAFTSKGRVPGSSRALGWDTMLPTSSCGTRMSASAFGHVGFTGTSLWIDPERDRYFVLLTNRACGGGTPDQMRQVRRAFHDALGDL